MDIKTLDAVAHSAIIGIIAMIGTVALTHVRR
jgi:hypothetical protein